MSTYNPYSYRPSPPKRASFWPLILLVVLGVILGLLLLDRGLGWKFWPQKKPDLTAGAQPRLVEARGNLSEEEQMTIEIYKTVAPSVVHVSNIARQSAPN